MKLSQKNIIIVAIIIAIIIAGGYFAIQKGAINLGGVSTQDFKKDEGAFTYSKVYGKEGSQFIVELRGLPEGVTADSLERKVDNFINSQIINQKMNVSRVVAEAYASLPGSLEIVYTIYTSDGRTIIQKDGGSQNTTTLSQQDAIAKVLYEYCGESETCRNNVSKDELSKYLTGLLTPSFMSSLTSYQEKNGVVYIIPLSKTETYDFLGEVRVFVSNK